MTIVSRPPEQHICDVHAEHRPLAPDDPVRRSLGVTHSAHLREDPPGTVRRCGCGKTWVAYRPDWGRGFVGRQVKWRPEGRFEGWRRERRDRRVASRRLVTT